MIFQSQEMISRSRSNRPHKLFDYLLTLPRFKTDAQLAKALHTTPSYLCTMRSGERKIGASLILAVYDATDMTIEQIRELL